MHGMDPEPHFQVCMWGLPRGPPVLLKPPRVDSTPGPSTQRILEGVAAGEDVLVVGVGPWGPRSRHSAWATP